MFFFAEGSAKDYLISINLNVLKKSELLNYKFDLIIFSEIYHFFSGNIKESISYNELKEISHNSKIATFDTLNLGNNKKAIINRQKEIPYYKRVFPIRSFPNIEFSTIKPCPINIPQENSKYNYYWSFNSLSKSKNHIFDIRKIINLNPKSKTVIYSLSKWQYLRLNNRQRLFFKLLIEYLINIFEQIKQEIFFIVIVPNNLIKSKLYKYTKLHVFNLDSNSLLKPELYEGLLLNSDLIITTNIIQSSFMRAILTGVSGLNLTGGNYNLKNNTSIQLFEILKELCPELISKFNLVYPKSAKTFKGSTFGGLFESIEFGKESELIEIIKTLLFDENYNNFKKEQLKKLLKKLKGLDSETEIVNKIINL